MPVPSCDRALLRWRPGGPSAAAAAQKSQKQQFCPFLTSPGTASRYPESRSECTVVALQRGVRKRRLKSHGLFQEATRSLWTLSDEFLSVQKLFFYLILLNLRSLIIILIHYQLFLNRIILTNCIFIFLILWFKISYLHWGM